MSRQMKRPVYAGATLDIEVMTCTDPASGKIKDAKPKLRFKDDAEREEHRKGMALRRFIRNFNDTFHPGDHYITNTLDDAHEVHTFDEANRIRENYRRRIKYHYPNAVAVIVMGRGKSTNRIHFHTVARGIPLDALVALWSLGKVLAKRPLRAHNFYEDENGNKIDHGADFRGLATYMFNHWTEEQGGHYYMATKNMNHPDLEKPTEVKCKYTPDKPPKPPKGYLYIGCDPTPYGYACYHYVIDPSGRAGLEPAPT